MTAPRPPRIRVVAAAFVLLVATLVVTLSGVALDGVLERRATLPVVEGGLRGVIGRLALALVDLLPAAHGLVLLLAAAYLWLSGAGLRSGRDVLDTSLNVAARSLVTVAGLWLGFVLLVTVRSMVLVSR
jgi:hypothetical protein